MAKHLNLKDISKDKQTADCMADPNGKFARAR